MYEGLEQVGIEPTTKRIMRGGESSLIQHKPTAMDTMIETSASKIYWFLMDDAGEICQSLHRHCTAKAVE
jgi:hypothetical protein